MALSPLPQPPSRFTLPPQQLLPSSFLKPSLLLPSPPSPPAGYHQLPAARWVPLLRPFFFFLFFFFFTSLFSPLPFLGNLDLFMSRSFVNFSGSLQEARGRGGRKSGEGVPPSLLPPIHVLPLPRGRESEADLGVGCRGGQPGAPGRSLPPPGTGSRCGCPGGPGSAVGGGGAALERCGSDSDSSGGSSPVRKPASTKVVPAPGEGPRNWPWPRSEAGGLLCCLPHHSLRSSPDRSKC